MVKPRSTPPEGSNHSKLLFPDKDGNLVQNPENSGSEASNTEITSETPQPGAQRDLTPPKEIKHLEPAHIREGHTQQTPAEASAAPMTDPSTEPVITGDGPGEMTATETEVPEATIGIQEAVNETVENIDSPAMALYKIAESGRFSWGNYQLIVPEAGTDFIQEGETLETALQMLASLKTDGILSEVDFNTLNSRHKK